MTKSELEALLRTAGRLVRERDFFLIGSQALRGSIAPMPRDFPNTFEADLYPRRYRQAAMLRHNFAKPSAVFRRIADLPVHPARREQLVALLNQLSAEMRIKRRAERKS